MHMNPTARLAQGQNTPAGSPPLYRRADGKSRLLSLLILLGVSSSIYIGFHYVPHLMAHHAMKDFMLDQAKVAQLIDNEEIRRHLVAEAREWDLPLEADDFFIMRHSDKMLISATWEVSFVLLDGWYRHTMVFHPEIEERF